MAGFVMVTEAPATTAPFASYTVPRNEVVETWEKERAVTTRKNPNRRVTTREPERMKAPPPGVGVTFEKFSQESGDECETLGT
jgi:hypothetical protein